MVIMFVALAGFGILRSDFILADQPSTNDNPTSTVTSDLLAAQTSDGATVTELSVADIAEASNPAVVTVYNLQTLESQNMFPGQNQPDTDSDDPQRVASGSGWIYDSDGHVVTNAHVVDGAESVQVQFYDGTTAEAEVIGVDTIQDVAVLKLNLEDGQELPGVLPVGDSGALRAGDEIVAIGSPLGEYANTVTDGIVGGLDRSLDTDAGGSLDNLIQHDAEISSGNSGGPLLNMQGEFIGMNVAKIDSTGQQNVSVSGLNFAIDGNTVVDRVNQIIKDGTIVYPYLGVESQETDNGTMVVNVVPDGPADTAGIQAGDVITAVAGVDIESVSGLTELLFEHHPGDSVDFTILRDGETLTITVTLGERPSSIS
jgi:2-alkenal reductase